jgi:hypothetical protein
MDARKISGSSMRLVCEAKATGPRYEPRFAVTISHSMLVVVARAAGA